MKLRDFDSMGKYEGLTAWAIAIAMPFAAAALLIFIDWLSEL